MKSKEQKKHKVILKKCPYTCPHCNKDIIIKNVTIERIGEEILIPCIYCEGLMRIKVVGPLLSNFVIEGFNSRENVKVEK